MNLKWMGVRGSGQDAEARRERAANTEAVQRQLDAMMPTGPWEKFMTPEEIRIAACVDTNSPLLRLVHDTIRKRHMSVLVELAAWEPGQPTDALVLAAGRVKELTDLDKTIEEIVETAGRVE
jgi:hypothetical protein